MQHVFGVPHCLSRVAVVFFLRRRNKGGDRVKQKMRKKRPREKQGMKLEQSTGQWPGPLKTCSGWRDLMKTKEKWPEQIGGFHCDDKRAVQATGNHVFGAECNCEPRKWHEAKFSTHCDAGHTKTERVQPSHMCDAGLTWNEGVNLL